MSTKSWHESCYVTSRSCMEIYNGFLLDRGGKQYFREYLWAKKRLSCSFSLLVLKNSSVVRSEATRTRSYKRCLRDIWNREISQTMARNTVNRLVRKEIYLNSVVPERSMEEYM